MSYYSSSQNKTAAPTQVQRVITPSYRPINRKLIEMVWDDCEQRGKVPEKALLRVWKDHQELFPTNFRNAVLRALMDAGYFKAPGRYAIRGELAEGMDYLIQILEMEASADERLPEEANWTSSDATVEAAGKERVT